MSGLSGKQKLGSLLVQERGLKLLRSVFACKITGRSLYRSVD